MRLDLRTPILLLDRDGDPVEEGRVVARSYGAPMYYDVRMKNGELIRNVPQERLRIREVMYVG